MSEPEVALAFTPDPWVEQLHRYCSDHGGARVRSLVVDAAVALEESYDVFVVGHRWSALSRAFVGDVHARGRAVLGVHDRQESSSRSHLLALGVDALIEADADTPAFVRAIVDVAGVRAERPAHRSITTVPRRGRLVTVGGASGAGRTEIAVQLAVALDAQHDVVLLDADDVAPSVAARLHLAIEPNLRTAIDAVEHDLGSLDDSIQAARTGGPPVVTGLPNARAWEQVRPGEVIRVADRLAADAAFVVVDGAGPLEEVATASRRARYATGRALVAEADMLVGVCEGSPHGVARILAWTVEVRLLAPATPLVIVVNRAPDARFRRGELYEELTTTVPLADVVFVPSDPRVADAAWKGGPVARGPFTRAVEALAAEVAST